jgi:rubrerythrin
METLQSCNALEALNDALCREEESKAFYLKAAERTLDNKGAGMFHSLADAAIVQIELLESQIETLAADDTWSLPECVLDCDYDVETATLPLDQASFERAVRADTSDTEAIVLALGAESANYNVYARQAKSSPDEQARRFYTYLAEQTLTRLDLLMLNYESVSPVSGWTD